MYLEWQVNLNHKVDNLNIIDNIIGGSRNRLREKYFIITDKFFTNTYYEYDNEEMELLKNMHQKAVECQLLTIEGFKEIRHDAILRFRFRLARQIKKQIKEMQLEIKN